MEQTDIAKLKEDLLALEIAFKAETNLGRLQHIFAHISRTERKIKALERGENV